MPTPARSAQDAEHAAGCSSRTSCDTEALRILLPVATALIEERMASFAAALMAGVAAKYGGDPDHLAVVTATMPDQETGRAPSVPGAARHTAAAAPAICTASSTGRFPRGARSGARGIVAECPCKEEGKEACHRCLLSHVSGAKYDLV